MSDTNVTVIGNVASDVQSKPTHNGAVTSFRLASQRRFFNRRAGRWVDDDPAFYRVVCWRSLAENVRDCVRKGEPVVVQGRLKLRDWTDNDGHKRTDAEVDAWSIGYDLMRGTAAFTRSRRQPLVTENDDDPLDNIRSEQRANADHDVIVDPSTGEVFTLSQLREADDVPDRGARAGAEGAGAAGAGAEGGEANGGGEPSASTGAGLPMRRPGALVPGGVGQPMPAATVSADDGRRPGRPDDGDDGVGTAMSGPVGPGTPAGPSAAAGQRTAAGRAPAASRSAAASQAVPASRSASDGRGALDDLDASTSRSLADGAGETVGDEPAPRPRPARARPSARAKEPTGVPR